MAAFPLPARTSSLPTLSSSTQAPSRDAGMSLVNLAARQRMLSQRMVLQTVLAARGSDLHLKAARSSLTLFTDSQARLVDTPRHLDATSAEIIRKSYHGPQGVGATIDAFAQQVGTALDLAERQSPRVEDALARLVETTDGVLDALNTATTAFDQVSKAQSETLMKELAGIVASIQTVAREAKVVSFNAQVMAARRAARARVCSGGQCAVGHHQRDRWPVAAGGVAGWAQPERGLSGRVWARKREGPGRWTQGLRCRPFKAPPQRTTARRFRAPVETAAPAPCAASCASTQHPSGGARRGWRASVAAPARACVPHPRPPW